MSKFLRKYKQWILVVGMSLLMVAWLFPQALQQFGSMGMSTTIARFDGGRITVKSHQDAQQELRALGEVSPMLVMALGLSDGRSLSTNAAEHWMLLSYEAKKGGWIGGVEDGASMLDEIAASLARRQQMFGQGGDVAQARAMLENGRQRAVAGTGQQTVDRALSAASGVLRMMQAARSLGLGVSAKESTLFAWELFDAAVVDLLVVPASSVAGELKQPDEARIAAHWAEFKDKRPGETELGIGYKRQPAVKVEWLTVARSAVVNAMPADAIEVNKFWRANRARFGENFSEARAGVEQAYKAQQAEAVLDKAREAINRAILKVSAGVENDGRYKKLPADWKDKMPSMEALAQAARDAMGIEGASGMVFASPSDGTFRTALDLRALVGIGNSMGRVGDVPNIAFAEASINVREMGVESLVHTQTGVLYGPLSDPMGSSEYYFRVLEARPESAPDSSAEVIEQVKGDIATKEGFELLKSRVDEYKARLAEKGVAGMLDVPSVRTALDTVVRRESMDADKPGETFPLQEANTPKVREAVMALVEGWDPKADVAAMPAAQRVVAVAEPAAKGLVLAMVKARRPLTTERLTESDAQIVSYARNRILEPSFNEDSFTFRRLEARLNYKSYFAGESEKSAEAEAPKSAS